MYIVQWYTPSQPLSVTVPAGDAHSEIGSPARLLAQVAVRWGAGGHKFKYFTVRKKILCTVLG
jgi:hypothetical protein